MSGASAAGSFLEKVLTGSGVAADQLCDVSQPIWKFKDNIDGATQKAYLCTRSTTATNLTLLPTDKANILVYKRDEGGSGYGVSPIIAEANGDAAGANIEFLKIDPATTCTIALNGGVAYPAAGAGSAGLTNITCNYTTGAAGINQLAVPDVGISDVDPAQFKGVNAPFKTDNVTLFNDVSAADVAKMTVTPGAAVVFGVPATLHLYRALQAAQLSTGQIPTTAMNNTNSATVTCAVGDTTNTACMPSLSKQEVATLIKGDWNSWDKIKVGTTGIGLKTWADTNAAADKAASAVTHICRRENGSGTQAQLNNFALNYPCSAASSNTLPASGNDGINGNTGTRTEASGLALIHENSTAGRVTACLNNLDLGADTAGDGFTNPYTSVVGGTSVRWAIGAQSLEKKDAHFEFIKINGVAPTLANVVAGNYPDWFENTFQYNTTHAKFSTDAGLKNTIDMMIKASVVPAVMASINGGFVHNFGTGAYLANPKANTPPTTGIFNSSLPVNPYSHTPLASVTLDNCRAPVAYNKSVAGL